MIPRLLTLFFPRRRRPDLRTTLTPRVVVRPDGLAYITFTRPRPQRSTPA